MKAQLRLSRSQLSDFLGDDFDAVRQFERLFEVVNVVSSSGADEVLISAANAEADAQLALALLSRLNDLAELAATAPVVDELNILHRNHHETFNGIKTGLDTSVATNSTNGAFRLSGSLTGNISADSATGTSFGCYFNFSGIAADASGTHYAGRFTSTTANTGASTGVTGGIFVNAVHAGTGTQSSLRAINFQSTANAAGGSGLRGAFFTGALGGTTVATWGTVSSYGCTTTLDNANLTVSNLYGLDVDFVFTSAAAVTNFYGFFIGSQTLAGVTDNTTAAMLRLGSLTGKAGKTANAYMLKTDGVTGATNNYQVDLGAGISVFRDTTAAVSTASGSVQLKGGLGVAGDVHCPTAAPGTNTTQAATTAFVTAAFTAYTPSFSTISSGTNTTAAMVVSTGASLTFGGTGTINASTLGGATFAAPGAIGGTTPGSAAFTTITAGTWNGTAIGPTYGGTNQTTWTLGDLLYSDGANTLAKLAGNTTTTQKVLVQIGTGLVSAAPSWAEASVVVTAPITGNGTSGSPVTLAAATDAVPGYMTSADHTSLTGKAAKTDNLSVFAATTSAQLAGVISDETGSGALVFGTAPTMSAPVVTGGITVTGGESFGSQIKRLVVRKTGVADNVATDIFTVTTTNESGSTDGGTYSCRIKANIAHGGTTTNSVSATLYGDYIWSRVMLATGVGTNSTVEVVKQTASVSSASATKDIGTVTVTVTETSEYVQTVAFTVDLTGTSISTAIITCDVEVLYSSFTTPPTIAAV